MLPNIYHAIFHRPASAISPADAEPKGRLALCLRFRDEARFLAEWLEYHLAAGVQHFFLYNNFSQDNYLDILRPYLDAGHVTLIDWPRTPASPDAENDCISRTRGRFRWVGFLDADEFAVVRDGRSLPDFLDGFSHAPAVALHWYSFGSNGHEVRPANWVIQAYTSRSSKPGEHFKVFVRPEQVTVNRNAHNFYYLSARCAVREDGRAVTGSMAFPPTAQIAWVNHYYWKSLEDYLDKAARRKTQTVSGKQHHNRDSSRAQVAMTRDNEVFDQSALEYFQLRLAANAAEKLQDPGL
jgi:hypothetical protein